MVFTAVTLFDEPTISIAIQVKSIFKNFKSLSHVPNTAANAYTLDAIPVNSLKTANKLC